MLTFTAEGDYPFKVVETGDAPANWTYATGDDNAKTITIHVTDPDNGGQLVASYDKDAANNPTFTN
ncbi:Spy0128 family protein, partial [Faecalicatena contorta]|uniref:Spy0128 family protein n=1 Tax=Faecalicatena contorta TaxID=39482 RepID=UPI001FAE8BEB